MGVVNLGLEPFSALRPQSRGERPYCQAFRVGSRRQPPKFACGFKNSMSCKLSRGMRSSAATSVISKNGRSGSLGPYEKMALLPALRPGW
jgi:hypothetical protein